MSSDLKPITGRPKQPRIMETVTQLARQLGPGERLPTIQELSRALQVSVVTLDNSLRKLEARGYIERKHGSGIYVLPGVFQRTVGLIFGRDVFSPSASYFYAPLLTCCERRAASHNENSSFFLDLDGKDTGRGKLHHDLEEALSQRRLDGLLLIACHSQEQERAIRSRNVPTVSFNIQGGEFAVSPDHRKLVDFAVRELASQGCRRLALLGIRPDHRLFFLDAVREAGLETKSNWILTPSSRDTYPFHVEHHEAKGFEQASLLLERFRGLPTKGKPDGWVITDDMLTRGACSALAGRGFIPGREPRIATHSNRGSMALREWEGNLTVVEFDPEECVEAMFELLERCMNGEKGPPFLVAPRIRPS